MEVKSKLGDEGRLCTYSMSKATIWVLRRRRCFIRKRRPSVGVVLEPMSEEAERREAMVEWTIVWARSSKTVDCDRR